MLEIPSQSPIEETGEKQNTAENSINEETENFRSMLYRFFEIMRENDIYAVKALCGLKTFELANADSKVEEELENQLIEHYKSDKDKSGFFVFEGAHPENRTVLFKLKLKDVDPREAGHSELHFYKDIAPLLQGYLIDKKIQIPQLLDGGFSEEDHSYIITTFFEGEILGKINDTENPLPIEEYQEIIEFIHFFQMNLTPEKVNEISPDFILKESHWDKYLKLRTSFETEWLEIFGSEYIEKMRQLLIKNEQVLKSAPEIFTNQDIQPSNIIISEDNITLIDWERLAKVHSVATAYNHIIESHWRFPKLQQEMIRRALKLNKDNSDFKPLFRIDMIFAQYTRGCEGRLRKLKNPDLSEEERKAIQEDLTSVTMFIKEAIDDEGSWQEN